MSARSACQISNRPAASISTQTSATLPPPILSGRCANSNRMPMKAMPKKVKANEALPQFFAANNSAMNVVMTPRPTPHSINPRPGTHTAPNTL